MKLLIKGLIIALISIFMVPLLLSGQAGSPYTIQEIPDPKLRGQNSYVSDPESYLSRETVKKLDSLSTDIAAVGGSEYAVVIVDDYVGESDFQFALELFNTWGLGKQGVDNGLLLFIAVDRQEYRFISGRGMEALFPDIYLHRLGQKHLVPKFKKGRYDEGLIETSEFVTHILTSPDSVKELESMMPEVGPFWRWSNPVLINTLLALLLAGLIFAFLHYKLLELLNNVSAKATGSIKSPIFIGFLLALPIILPIAFVQAVANDAFPTIFTKSGLDYLIIFILVMILTTKIYKDYKTIIKEVKDAKDRYESVKTYLTYAALPILFLPPLWFVASTVIKYFRSNEGRFDPPDTSGNWGRINRNSSTADKFLEDGHKVEENIGSLIYEVWHNTQSGEQKLIAWDLDRMHSACPQCNYRTLHNEVNVIESATTSKAGLAELYNTCDNCDHHQLEKTIILPKIQESSGSSGSSGSSSRSSGSSSSSSRGSWGGGSSGGGGAGGRW